jgi:hypothetical protein
MKRLINKWRMFQASIHDKNVSRRLIGTDRRGNKYYQYYDDNMVETSRECEDPDDFRTT